MHTYEQSRTQKWSISLDVTRLCSMACSGGDVYIQVGPGERRTGNDVNSYSSAAPAQTTAADKFGPRLQVSNI